MLGLVDSVTVVTARLQRKEKERDNPAPPLHKSSMSSGYVGLILGYNAMKRALKGRKKGLNFSSSSHNLSILKIYPSNSCKFSKNLDFWGYFVVLYLLQAERLAATKHLGV